MLAGRPPRPDPGGGLLHHKLGKDGWSDTTVGVKYLVKTEKQTALPIPIGPR